MNRPPYRQIHLDFHTSPHIPAVGQAFNPEEFVSTLKRSHVNSINLFAKCHHGLYYYPTAIGQVHPSMPQGLDLLGEQIAACRSEGIRALVYTTVVWAEDTCDRHPEWMQVDMRGVLGARDPFYSGYNTEQRAWRSLCMNNPDYVVYLKEELREINDRYHPDGFWMDIIFQFRCTCPHCRAEMRAMGLNPQNPRDCLAHDRHVEIKFSREMRGYIKSLHPELQIYFNGCPAEFDRQDQPELSTARRRECNDFIDIESLPSEVWGYTHFPVMVNYCNRFERPLTMMNGKFHKTWGDFGSLRNTAQLEYESFRALANGAGVCVGDQLHPSGRLDPTVYTRIGQVFEQIQQKEPWCVDTKKLSQIGVYAPNRVLENEQRFDVAKMGINASSEGVYRMLSELHYLFDFIDITDDIGQYEAVILPDSVLLDPDTARTLSRYLAQGGKVLATGKSGLDETGRDFALPELPLHHLGDEEFSPTYAAIRSDQFPAIPDMEYAVYERGQRVEATGGQLLAAMTPPYFNRSYDRFCSHRQTPPVPEEGEHPFAVQSGNIIYFTHPLFRDYALNGCKVHKDLIAEALSRLIAKPLIAGALPSTLETTLRKGPHGTVIHLLHYIPMKRCKSVETIEEIIPLYQIELSVRVDQPPRRLYRVPDGEAIPFQIEGDYVRFTIPSIMGHEMVLVEG